MDELSDYSHAVAIIKAAVEQSRYRALQAGNAFALLWYREICFGEHKAWGIGN